MSTATVTTKGQITIPKKIRQALDLRAGDQLVFVVEGDKAFIYPSRKRTLSQLRGALKSKQPYTDYASIRQAAGEMRGQALEDEATG